MDLVINLRSRTCDISDPDLSQKAVHDVTEPDSWLGRQCDNSKIQVADVKINEILKV